jgi:hypothetical protein
MTEAAFEARLDGIFAGAESAVGGRLLTEKARTENLQAQDTRRVAFILTEAIEAELKPAVEKALASYDAAIERPITPNPIWEKKLRARIDQAAGAAIKKALAVDSVNHPWKPLLSAEAPKLSQRLLDLADAHFAALVMDKRRRRKKAGAISETVIRVGLFVAGLALGVLLMRLMR